jgi:hypothetical protein
VLIKGHGPFDPDRGYLVGMLGPRKIDKVEETDSVDLDLGATVSQEADLPETVNPRMLGKLWVSSMGLTFELACDDDAPRRIVVEVDAGRYVSEEGEDADGAKARVRRRTPLHWSVEVDLGKPDLLLGLGPDGQVVEQPDLPGIRLRSRVRDHHGRRVVRVSLVNAQEPEVTPKFRHRPDFAGGHNVAVRPDQREGDSCAWRLVTEWMPAADVPIVDPPAVPGLETGMDHLADLATADDPAPLIAALRPLITEYGGWLVRQRDSVAGLAEAWHPVAYAALDAADTIVGRLETAIDLLDTDPQARQAFAFANRAMRLQRHNTTAALLRDADPQLSFADALAKVSEGDEGDPQRVLAPVPTGLCAAQPARPDSARPPGADGRCRPALLPDRRRQDRGLPVPGRVHLRHPPTARRGRRRPQGPGRRRGGLGADALHPPAAHRPAIPARGGPDLRRGGAAPGEPGDLG